MVTISLTQFVGTGEDTACETDSRTLQSAVIAFRTQDSGWPTAAGGAGDIVWNSADDNGDLFSPDYVLETPESDTDCDWGVNADGVIGRQAADGSCPCEDDVLDLSPE